MKLNKRQSLILDYINKHNGSTRLEIENYVEAVGDKMSKNTIIRDLDVLLKNNYINKIGSARSIKYLPVAANELLMKYDIDNYFKTDVDGREIRYPHFNFDVYDNLKNLFSAEEIKRLENINKIYINKINNLSHTLLKKEYERLLIELSWKSSQIEGNTYSLLKKALEFIFENKDYYKNISLKKIEELHTLLITDLGVYKGLRKSPVGIVGTNYKPLSNRLQIKEAVDKLINIVNYTENIIEKALIAVLMISYIQPFEDGNKRTGRILANAILFANGYCPLSYRSINESDYKKAVIIFYENNSLDYFKKLFVEQFKFAVEKYF